VIVAERRTQLDEAGAGIQLSPNASRILVDLGLGPALSRRAARPERLVVRGVKGREIGIVPLGKTIEARHGAPYWALHRADLHAVLLDAVRAQSNIELRFGRRMMELTNQSDRALMQVETDGGRSERLEGSFAIAADGIWSQARMRFGGSAPRFRNAHAWRALVPREAAPPALHGMETGLWLGPDLHVVHYPVQGGAALNIVAVIAAREPLPGWSNPGDPALLARHVTRAAPDLHALIGASPDWRVWSLYDAPVPPRLGDGRIALLGDAAHPVLPYLAQGGALAIEDAVVLVKALQAAPDDPAKAIAAYGTARGTRVRRVQEAARANGRTYHLSGPAALIRDMTIRALGPDRMLSRYDWLYGWTP
jgi:salicylate hydroxylase